MTPRRYIHTQSEPSDHWVIEHDLDTADVYVQLVGNDGKDLMFDPRGYTDHGEGASSGPATWTWRDRIEVYFGAPVAGRAIVIAA